MKTNTRALATAAMIASCYTILTLALAPISYGMLQVRVSEALTLLPVYSPVAVWGVSVGCLLSNIFGLFMGANILGVMDIFLGTLATLIAALLSRALRKWRWRGLPVLSAIPPILCNGLIIGLELAYVMAPEGAPFLLVFITQALWVALGETVSCLGLGLLLCWALERAGLDKRLTGL